MKALKKYIIAAAALPVILGSASVFAANGQPGQGQEPRDSKRPMMKHCQPQDGERFIMRQLNLSPEQRDQIRSIHQQERDQMRAEMQALRAEEDKLVLSKDFDQKQAMTLAKKMSDERIEHRAQMLETKHKVLNVLTPEQKAKWAELHQKGLQDNDQCRLFKHGKGGPDFKNGSQGQGPRAPMDE